MNIDILPPQSTVTSGALVPAPAQFLPRHDALDQNKPQPPNQDHYSPDAYFPPADSLWSFSGRSSSFQDLNGMAHVSQVWGTAVATEIAQPQMSPMTMPAYPTPFFFQPPSNPRVPPTIYGRMASPATRQRTIQACTNCRERKTKCSGMRPACQRCCSRGLICHYASVSSRDTKLQNISRVHHRGSHSSRSSEVTELINKAPPVRISPTVLAPQPVRPPIITGMSSTLSRAAISERWIPSMQPMLYHLPHSEYPKETGSALGLTGVFTKAPSTITPGLAPQELTPRATKDATPTMTPMLNQYIITSPTNFSLGQRMSWDHQNHDINGHRHQPLSTTNSNNSFASSNTNSNPPGSSMIPLGQYAMPLVAESPTSAVDSGSSPTSSYNSSSSSSMDSAAPSSVTSGPTSDLPTTKSPSLLTSTEQAQYLPGEDFSFMTDPAYYEYLVKSTTTGGNVAKGKPQRSFSVAESMTLQYP